MVFFELFIEANTIKAFDYLFIGLICLFPMVNYLMVDLEIYLKNRVRVGSSDFQLRLVKVRLCMGTSHPTSQ